MEDRPPNYGEPVYFGTGDAGSFHRAQPLVLAALLTAFFALTVWQGNTKTAGSTARVQTVDSGGASQNEDFDLDP